jgi:hypothetical protein
MEIKSIKKISKINPAVLIQPATFGGIFWRVIDSISTKSNRPPSRAGKGMRLINARLMEISATRESK